MSKKQCKWVVRPGTEGTYWAYTPCKKGFNYLSKAKTVDDIKTQYENRICPICGGNIHLNLELVEGMWLESGETD